jgi:hypothetical protein
MAKNQSQTAVAPEVSEVVPAVAPASAEPGLNVVLAAIAESMKANAEANRLLAEAQHKQVELDRERYNPGHAELLKQRLEQRRKTQWPIKLLQCGYEAPPDAARNVSKDTLKHLADLKPGRYINDRVTVRRTDEVLFIDYPVDTMQQRMENLNYWSSFSDLVQKMHIEQTARDAQRA